MHPSSRQDLHFEHCIKYFHVKKLIPHFTVETFAIAVLPGASRFDIGCCHIDLREPFSELRCSKFRSVIASYIIGGAFCNEQIGQYLDYLDMVPLPFRDAGKAFPRIFINDIEPSDFTSIAQSILYKIITPYMVNIFWPKSDTTSVIEPKPTFLWLFFGTLRPCSLQVLSTRL